jgi:excisionase family DNA binding protein
MTGAEFHLLTKQDIAKLLRCSVRTIENLVNQGQIPAPVAVGRRVFWHTDRFFEWLDGRFAIPGAPPEAASENIAHAGAAAPRLPNASVDLTVAPQKTSAHGAVRRARARQARSLMNLANE